MTNLAPDRAALAAPDGVLLADPRCRNCGMPAAGAYCPQCGQETTIALPTARQFVKDAAGRYVSLDGRLWRTLAALLVHPEHLTREYLAGRRRRYVRPARLFLVLSIAMFALFRIVIDTPMVTDTTLVKFDAEVEATPAPSRQAAGDAPAGPRIRGRSRSTRTRISSSTVRRASSPTRSGGGSTASTRWRGRTRSSRSRSASSATARTRW